MAEFLPFIPQATNTWPYCTERFFYDHLLVFPLLGWATFPVVTEYRNIVTRRHLTKASGFSDFFSLLPP